MIYLVCTTDLTYDQRMMRICAALTEHGRVVTLVGRQKRGSLPLQAQKYEQKRLNCFFEKGKLFYFEFNLRLFFFLLFRSCQAICAVDLDTLLPAVLVSKIKRIPCVFDAHEYFTETPEVVNRHAVKKIWERVARWSIPKCAAAYTVSPQLAEIFSEQYKIPFGVVRNVPLKKTALPRPTPPSPTLNTSSTVEHSSPSIHSYPSTFHSSLFSLHSPILYQGALNEGRCLEAYILAMKELEGVELWLAGEGDLSDKLRQLAKDAGVENKVKFLGYVLPADLKQLTQQAWLGLNLLENNGLSYYYSLANKFFDYIQAGTPSLNPDFPEYRRIHEEFPVGLLLEKTDPASIAAAIVHLKSNPHKYQNLRDQCALAAEVFYWEKEKEELLRKWDELRIDN